MQAPVFGQALDRANLVPLRFNSKGETAQNWLVVDEHGARAAMAHLATVLGPGEPEVFTEHLEQRLIRVAGALKSLPVNGQSEQLFGGCYGHSATSLRSIARTRVQLAA